MTAAGGNSDRPRNRKVAAVASIGFAYSAPTIVTWSHWSVPLTLGFSAVGGTPLIAGFTARAARVDVRPTLSWLSLAAGWPGFWGRWRAWGWNGAGCARRATPWGPWPNASPAIRP